LRRPAIGDAVVDAVPARGTAQPSAGSAAQADADDAPILLAGQGETAVDVEGLMRAMEIAHAEMRDAALESAAVVGRCRHLGRQLRERAGVEFGHARLSLTS
jgi:hypothetical protein